MQNNLKPYEKSLLVKEIYPQAFSNLGNLILKKYLQFFTWFCSIMFIMVLYAFVFRISRVSPLIKGGPEIGGAPQNGNFFNASDTNFGALDVILFSIRLFLVS